MIVNKFLFLIAIVAISAQCTHTPDNPQNSKNDPDITRLPAREHYHPPVIGEYETKLFANTVNDSLYKGLINIFQYHASLMTREVVELQLKKQADYNGWDDKKLSEKREKFMQEASSKSFVFMAFYAPDRVNDRMIHKESPWNMYLVVNGQKYKGTPKKSPYNLPEFRRLYPYQNPWLTGYMIEFPVPTSSTENAKVEFVLTGAPGTSERTFGEQNVRYPADSGTEQNDPVQ